jgi:hypothetical protein
MKTKLASLWLVLVPWCLVSMLLLPEVLPPVSAGARNPCVEPGNLTYNCGFDDFVEQAQGDKRFRIPEGWWYFILAGDPDFRSAEDTYWGAPSLWILSDGMGFTAGIYQQVAVTPGVVYQTDIGWAAARCNFDVCQNMERRLGLDPAGGTDPTASSVVWSRIEAGGDKWPDLTVSARAAGPTMTVFLWVNHPSSSGLDEIYLDAVGLWPDPNQPAATVTPRPSPTPTRKPPTSTPKPAPPTATPTEPPPASTDTLVPPTALPLETEAPPAVLSNTVEAPLMAPSPTSTWTPTAVPPTLTPTPTHTPTMTPVPVAELARLSTYRPALAEDRAADRGTSGAALLLYVAGAAVAGAVGLVAIVLWLWLRSRRLAAEKDG